MRMRFILKKHGYPFKQLFSTIERGELQCNVWNSSWSETRLEEFKAVWCSLCFSRHASFSRPSR